MYQRAEKMKVLYNLMNQHVVSGLLAQVGKMQFWEFLGDKEVTLKSIADNYRYHPEAVKRFMRVLNACQIIAFDEMKGTVKKGLYTDVLDSIAAPHLLDGAETLRFFEKTLIENQECYSQAFGTPFLQRVSASEEKIKSMNIWAQMRMDEWLYPAVCNSFNFLEYKIVCEWMGDGRFLLKLLGDNPGQKGFLHTKNPLNQKEDKQVKSEAADLYVFILGLLQLSNDEAISALNACYKAMSVHSKCLIIDFYVPKESEEGYLEGAVADINVFTCLGKHIRNQNEWLGLLKATSFKNIMFKTILGPPAPLAPMCTIELGKSHE